MKIYRPKHIFVGIGFLIFAFMLLRSSYIIWSTIAFVISISNFYYAFSNPKDDLPSKTEIRERHEKWMAKSLAKSFRESPKLASNYVHAKQTVICPSCNVEEELFDMAHREDSKIYIFNEGKPRVRQEDGLHIYPLVCFNCNKLTEWSFDPNNDSGKAINGVEYFETVNITRKFKEDALKESEINNHYVASKKIEELKIQN
tara:strand:- start:2925 stop:3527 length:603 start_codon:yes stop_codon:yes gene_type:complete